jgi:hypothetical protein
MPSEAREITARERWGAMSENPKKGPLGKENRAAAIPPELLEEDARCPFGPSFFLRQLRAFIRERCPDPAEGLPSVQLHLAEGECLEICHVIGIASRWLALAVIETERPVASPTMRTEVVPYGLISRVSVRVARPGPGRVGFEVDRDPALLGGSSSPEAAFLAMAGVTLPGSEREKIEGTTLPTEWSSK